MATIYPQPFFRYGKITSAYEYLEHRFGLPVRVYGSISFIAGQLVRVSIILYLISLVLYEITGLSSEICILIGGTFVAFYTVTGGIRAVIWTDVVQTIILVLGGVACLSIIIIKLPDGLSQIFRIASASNKISSSELVEGKLHPISWGISLTSKTGTMMLILGLTAWLTEYSGNQNVIQRYCASKNIKEARKAMYTCAFCSVPIWAFYMFLGTALFSFFHVFPHDRATLILSGNEKAEQILPFFMINYLPPGIAGLLISAVVAAAMSSLDSSIIKNRDDAHYLRMAQCTATITAAMMIFGAIILVNSETKTLQDTGTIIGSLLGGGSLGMYLLGFLTSIGDARAVGFGIISTILFTLWTILLDSSRGILPEALRFPFELYYTGIIGNIVMFAVSFLAATLLAAKARDMTNLTIWKREKISN